MAGGIVGIDGAGAPARTACWYETFLVGVGIDDRLTGAGPLGTAGIVGGLAGLIGGTDPERALQAGAEEEEGESAGEGIADCALGLFSVFLNSRIVSILIVPRFVGIVEAGGGVSAKTSQTRRECLVKALLGATAHPAHPLPAVDRTSAIFAAVTPIGKPVMRYLYSPTILAVAFVILSSSGRSASLAAAALAFAKR